jgi:hypothetical protein
MKRRLTLLAAFAGLALMACTPEEVDLWTRWHAADPAAAEAFLDGRAAAPAIEETVWDRLAECESGGDWSINTGTYDGGLQFHPDTWRGFGGTEFAEFAWQATREQQITVAERVLDSSGWGAWPACSRKLGLR